MPRDRDRDGNRAEVRLVEIGTAGDTVEGAMIREFLASHGIDCLVQGEHHRSLLPGLASAIIELRLLVPRARAEEASELLRAFRQANEGGADPDDGEDVEPDQAGEEPRDDDLDEAGWGDAAWIEKAKLRQDARRAVFLALAMPGLGLGHFSVGAKGRGLVLLATLPLALWLMTRVGPIALALVLVSGALDALAAPLALSERRAPAARLPRARLIERAGDRSEKDPAGR